jgi:hypothetical protein
MTFFELGLLIILGVIAGCLYYIYTRVNHSKNMNELIDRLFSERDYYQEEKSYWNNKYMELHFWVNDNISEEERINKKRPYLADDFDISKVKKNKK